MSEVFRVKTAHGTNVYLNGNSNLTHNWVGLEGDRLLQSEIADDGLYFYVLNRGGGRAYVESVNPDLKFNLTSTPTMFPVVLNSDASFSFGADGRFLSARPDSVTFEPVSRNSDWERLTLEQIGVHRRREAVLVLITDNTSDKALSMLNVDKQQINRMRSQMNQVELGTGLSVFDFERLRLRAVLMVGAGETFITIEGERVPLLSMDKFTRVLSTCKDCLWLVGSAKFTPDVWRVADLLVNEGVSRDQLINCEILPYVKRSWIGSLRYVERHPIDYFATGISYTEVGLNLDSIKGVRGINFGCSNQDIRQGYLTAKHVFEYQHSIKFVLIGLAPYSLRYDNRKAFTVCARNLQYMLALGLEPESEHDKILMSILNGKMRRTVSSITEREADLNNIGAKRTFDKELNMTNIANWRRELQNQDKPLWEDTVTENQKILESYIELCLEHGAKPIGVTFPLAACLRRNYPQDMLERFREFMRRLEAKYDFTLVDLFELPLDYDCFCNMSHLNIRGGLLTSSVLNDRLHELGVLPLNQRKE